MAERDLEAIKKVIAGTEVDNETLEWDCQDYVLEILDNLEVECLIDDDDETYKKQKAKPKSKRAEY